MGYGHAGAARSYRAVGVEARVDEADPHALILALFDGALERIGQARAAIAGGELKHKLVAISAANGIVEGLRRSLDFEAGGALAQRLDMLYEYCGRRLLHASIHNDGGALEEAASLLGELRAAWAEMPRHLKGGT